jgi:hypothetical protein
MPVTWRKGEFRPTPSTTTTRARVELLLRRGSPNLVLSLSHDHRYDPALVRSGAVVEDAVPGPIGPPRRRRSLSRHMLPERGLT